MSLQAAPPAGANRPRGRQGGSVARRALAGRRLVVHVGTLKTGSTTLQAALAGLGPDLRRLGIHVPAAGRGRDGCARHGDLRHALIGEGRVSPGGAWDRLAEEMRRSTARRFVISDEWFASAHEPRVPRFIAGFAASYGLDVDVVGYVRPQSQYFESRYAEMVKTNGEQLPFDLFCAASFFRRQARGHAWLNYRRAFAPWRAAFGGRVTVVPVEPSRLPAGVVGHFLGLLGAGELAGRRWPPVNKRPGAKETEVRRLAAVALARDGVAGWRERLLLLGGLPELLGADAPFAGLSGAQARELTALFDAENAAFVREYGIDHGGALFREPVADGFERPSVARWEDLEDDERRAARDYVRRTIDVDPAPRSRRAPRRRRAPLARFRFGSARWRAAWLLDARFRRWLRERAVAAVRRGGAGPRSAPSVLAGALRLVAAEARRVCGPRTAKAFASWLVVGAFRRAMGVAASGTPWLGLAPPPGRRQAEATRIAAAGPRSAAVFAAADRGGEGVPREVLAVLADTRADAARTGLPAAVLAERPALAVPAFDPAVYNPVGWRRTVDNRVAALGRRHRPPPGAPRTTRISPADRRRLLDFHHLEDFAAFHADAVARAGLLVQLAATGLPVHVADRDPELAVLLGPGLHGLMTGPVRGATAGERESLSIAMRRAALRDHTLGARARQVCAAAGAGLRDRPRVSVLLATRRPDLLGWAVANVARQNYPNMELVLALHGEGFGDVGAVVRRFSGRLEVVRVAPSRDLGAVLNAATSVASGELVAKMDDDDCYGPDHLWDLVLAYGYSGAHLVGKGAETVYLGDRDCTLTRQPGLAEKYVADVAGGTLLMARRDLDRLGGWPGVPRGVDSTLIANLLAAGGIVYRTHGAGFVLIRHGAGHTWVVDSAYFAETASAAQPGWRPGPAVAAGGPAPGRPRWL